MATPTKTGGKLEAMSKDDLIKFIRKQLIQSKEQKKKIEDLENDLNKDHEDISRLEKEKGEWLKLGVSAEMEKKDKLTKKELELQTAAKLGQGMLEENDALRTEMQTLGAKLDELQSKHDQALQDFEDQYKRLMKDKDELETTMNSMEEDYHKAKKDAKECNDALESMMLDDDQKSVEMENVNLKLEIKELQDKGSKKISNAAKLKEMKDKLNAAQSDNKTIRELKDMLEKEVRNKDHKVNNLHMETKDLKKEILVRHEMP